MPIALFTFFAGPVFAAGCSIMYIRRKAFDKVSGRTVRGSPTPGRIYCELGA